MKPQKIGLEIQKMISGQVLWDKQGRDLYSVDASSYLVKPQVVVLPKNEEGVFAILKFHHL